MNFLIITALILNLLGSVLCSAYVTNNVVHSVASETEQGTWKKKWSWKQRWVKTWKAKTIYVAHWTKVWTPAQTSEYIPLPPVPPNWIKPDWVKPTNHY